MNGENIAPEPVQDPSQPAYSEYLICDKCGAYPLEPVHGHYVCPKCRYITKCCEGGPQDQ